MTNRVLDTAIDQAVEAAQDAVHAIGDGISDLLPSQLHPAQLLPSRKAASRVPGRTTVLISTLAIVGLGVMIMLAKRRGKTSQQVHRDGSAYEETAESAMGDGREAADRVMATADSIADETAGLRI